MRSIILSGLIIASTVSTALGFPTASSSLVQSSFAVDQAHQAKASIDPRIERWARMKIALPDGLLPEDKAILEQQQQIVPMIVVDEIPQPNVLARKPIGKHQRIDIEPANKHMGITGDKDDMVEIAPFSSEMQQNLNRKFEASFSNVEGGIPIAAVRPYRKYLGINDSGESQIMNLDPSEQEGLNGHCKQKK